MSKNFARYVLFFLAGGALASSWWAAAMFGAVTAGAIWILPSVLMGVCILVALAILYTIAME